jgi:hypothetical protein
VTILNGSSVSKRKTGVRNGFKKKIIKEAAKHTWFNQLNGIYETKGGLQSSNK